ncbi:alpha/beta hydrolase [Palleronia sediminis]|uniref:Alpha/beta hydrolase n=1 Tax=Palleronia sediminis TaxID=2547833 RepID=A0A4R6AEW2_9RHOB|nr:alpha/beta hydrolase [Palleronia sediminis]TDL79803.1 alpha/beta hydrolase [Palleronia sediminis]
MTDAPAAEQSATDADYDNSGAVPSSGALAASWPEEAARFRTSLGARARTGLRYGATERERFDLFLPEGPPRGLAVFVHGGYWRSRDRSDFSHLAAGPLARGVAVAMPSYTLAPEARISRLTLQIRLAIAAAADHVPDLPIVLAGHSAGGHLVARQAAADVMLSSHVSERIARIVPISPVSDLRPLLGLAMNDDLRLTANEARTESPVLLTRAHPAPVEIHVGGDELPAFLWQARILGDAWDAPVHVAPGRHHFDIVDALRDADTPLCAALGP